MTIRYYKIVVDEESIYDMVRNRRNLMMGRISTLGARHPAEVSKSAMLNAARYPLSGADGGHAI